MCYNPPAGAIGDALARLIGADPKSLMDADLVRMKTLIETGKVPHDAPASKLGEVEALRGAPSSPAPQD
jgi:uncharacterized membrane protein